MSDYYNAWVIADSTRKEGDDPGEDPTYKGCLKGLKYRVPIYIVDPYFEPPESDGDLCLRVTFAGDQSLKANPAEYISFSKHGFSDLYPSTRGGHELNLFLRPSAQHVTVLRG